MTTTDHLQRIRARCVELLAIAEKRTPGKWEIHPTRSWPIIVPATNIEIPVAKVDCSISDTNRPYGEACNNATFIAACAGPAEAGWRSTIASIDWIMSNHQIPDVYSQDCVDEDVGELTNAIIAAWPEELL